MNRSQFRRSRVAAGVIAAASLLGAGHASGAAFALQEESASGLGNAFAGGAAAAEDASSMSVNPATLSKYSSAQVVLGVHFITPSMKFKNDGSQPAAFQPLGGDGGDAGSTNVVPNLYLAVPLNRDLVFGLGINVPFGLVTEYDDDFIGRFQGLKSDVQTINVNPALSWKVNDQFAIGGGVNWQHVKATFSQMVNYSGALAQAATQAAGQGAIPPELVPAIVGATPGLQSKSTVDASDSAWGWNVGMLWDVNPATRVGLSYRSPMKFKATGNVGFDNPTPSVPAPLAPVVGLLAQQVNSVALFNGGVNANVKLPDIANLSIFQSINDRWDWMADVQWTGWSTFKDLTFVRTTGDVLQSTPENFDDVWRVSVGTTYKYNDQWKFRGGVAFDQSPVNGTDRTVRLPDGDRTWLAAGLQYKFSPQLKFDLGAAYIFVDKPGIDQNAGSTAQNGLVKGHYDMNVFIVSGQMVYSF
ncbi:MAG TPA: outer membrane protein transport protein [Casimicrobiaceae bacterium]|nr:outer membrane protein transport protein [Casimicrobiaceae bacterium]